MMNKYINMGAFAFAGLIIMLISGYRMSWGLNLLKSNTIATFEYGDITTDMDFTETQIGAEYDYSYTLMSAFEYIIDNRKYRVKHTDRFQYKADAYDKMEYYKEYGIPVYYKPDNPDIKTTNISKYITDSTIGIAISIIFQIIAVAYSVSILRDIKR